MKDVTQSWKNLERLTRQERHAYFNRDIPEISSYFIRRNRRLQIIFAYYKRKESISY